MVYGIVHQNAGTISVNSEPRRGTTFRIRLPRVEEPLSHRPDDVSAEPSRRTGAVLIVEDEDSVRRFLEVVLRGAGYTVHSAGSPRAALEMIDREDLSFGVLATDVVMPHMSGVELSRVLRERDPDLHVVMISGYTGQALTDRDPTEVAARFLQKPFSPARLLEAVSVAAD
jgi:DNA-binding NtrC family response regulator